MITSRRAQPWRRSRPHRGSDAGPVARRRRTGSPRSDGVVDDVGPPGQSGIENHDVVGVGSLLGPVHRGRPTRPEQRVVHVDRDGTKNTYLGAPYHAIRGRRGTFKAVGAIRHDILIAYWHIVTADVGYQDLGVDWVARRHSREHQIARLAKQIEKLGAAVEITMPAA